MSRPDPSRAEPTPTPTTPAVVTRADLEARLDRVRAEVGDPRGGIFGPDSKVWEVNRESLVFLGAGRAALLQLAHPFVAFAIEQHSSTREDPLGRFQRTFAQVFGMVFGDLDQAFRAARVVHAIHRRITGRVPEATGPFAAGTAYQANEPEALLWVHATLWDTSVRCYERVLRPLSDAEKERYWGETRRFASLFGIPDAILPPSWTAFQRYMDDMLASDLLTVAPCAAEMARFLFEPPAPGLGPAMRWYARYTAWQLPERLAQGFLLERGGERGARRQGRDDALLRRLYPRLPRRIRLLPAYVEAERRLAGRTDRDRIGEWLQRAMVGPRSTR